LVLAQTNVSSTITGNYVDNSSIEWTNEYEADPAFANQYSFGGLTITGNIFLAGNCAPWLNWLVVKPYGPGHFIHGLNISGNVFRAWDANLARVEGVDTSNAPLDMSRMRNILVEGNSFNAINQVIANPVAITHDQAAAATTWTVQPGPFLPFGGWARAVESLVAEGMISGAANERRSDMPYVQIEQGASKQDVTLNWAAAAKGRVRVMVRMDTPN